MRDSALPFANEDTVDLTFHFGIDPDVRSPEYLLESLRGWLSCAFRPLADQRKLWYGQHLGMFLTFDAAPGEERSPDLDFQGHRYALGLFGHPPQSHVLLPAMQAIAVRTFIGFAEENRSASGILVRNLDQSLLHLRIDDGVVVEAKSGRPIHKVPAFHLKKSRKRR